MILLCNIFITASGIGVVCSISPVNQILRKSPTNNTAPVRTIDTVESRTERTDEHPHPHPHGCRLCYTTLDPPVGKGIQQVGCCLLDHIPLRNMKALCNQAPKSSDGKGSAQEYAIHLLRNCVGKVLASIRCESPCSLMVHSQFSYSLVRTR